MTAEIGINGVFKRHEAPASRVTGVDEADSYHEGGRDVLSSRGEVNSQLVSLDNGKFQAALTRYNNVDFKYLISPDDRTTLRDSNTNRDKIGNLAQGTVRIVNLVLAKKIDTVFFLDKSARPGAILFLQTWNRVFPGVKPPHIRFISPDSFKTIEEYDKGHIQEIRNRYKNVDGARILVVDEYVDSGGTLAHAKEIIHRALKPSADYYTGMFSKVPQWYNDGLRIGVIEGTGPNPLIVQRQPDLFGPKELRHQLHLIAELIAECVTVGERPRDIILEPYIPEYANFADGLNPIE